ncbi:cysteine hydrolase family protein [Kerstersia similis]|uniref:cysteine hydrolase family protein n=1 Tax=Kerstersia similis TaxID=206505 RepID=UPI0039F062B4
MKTEPLLPLGASAANQWQVNARQAVLVRPPRHSRPLAFPALPQHLTVDASRSALVVIDMQNDFCHPDGWLAAVAGVDVSAARLPIAPLRKLLPAVRHAGIPVLWLNWGNRQDRLNLSPSLLHTYNPAGRGTGLGDPLPANQAPVLQAGSWAAAIVDELQPAPQDIQVDKYRMSGFWDTSLDAILRNLQVSTLLFAGVNADQCVLATLMDANCLGYDCIYLDDCCATTSPGFCLEATRYNIRQCFGFTALSTDLLQGLESCR